ncbi:MAG: hypothetical protein AAF433_11195 [Bacteroidota bacterium]
MIQRLFFLLPALLLLACGGENAATTEAESGPTPAEVQEEAAYESMIAAHDRVMPRMGEISRAQIGLRDLMQQEGISEETMSAAKVPFDRLEAIHDGMMDWMREAMQPLDSVRAQLGSHEEVMAFYRAQEDAMLGMEEKLDPTFEEVNALLNNE